GESAHRTERACGSRRAGPSGAGDPGSSELAGRSVRAALAERENHPHLAPNGDVELASSSGAGTTTSLAVPDVRAPVSWSLAFLGPIRANFFGPVRAAGFSLQN